MVQQMLSPRTVIHITYYKITSFIGFPILPPTDVHSLKKGLLPSLFSHFVAGFGGGWITTELVTSPSVSVLMVFGALRFLSPLQSGFSNSCNWLQSEPFNWYL